MTEVRGYAQDKGQADWLRKHGLPDKAIYQRGRGAEDLDECIASFRGRVGKLLVAHDLRVFGLTKKEVAATMAQLEKGRIRVVDISHPGDTTIADLIHRASVAIQATGLNSRRAAKKLGRKGGLGKGVAAYLLRESLAPTWLIDKIMDSTDIAWPTKIELLSPHFKESTLRRHYGARAAAKRLA